MLTLGPMLLFLSGGTFYGQAITTIGVVTCTSAVYGYLVYQDPVRKR